jgi:acetyltransferase-like isoleucine patch superfamily enzyme
MDIFQNFSFIVSCIVVAILIFAFLKYFFLALFVSFVEKNRKKKYLFSQTPSSVSDDRHRNERNKPGHNFLANLYEGFYRYLQFKIGLLPSNHVRRWFYKHVFRVTVGKRVVFHFKTEIRGGFRIVIGDGTIIGDNVILDGRGGLVIGDNVNFSSNAAIYTMQHDYASSTFIASSSPVVIHDRAWISSNTIILPGVDIGEGAVLAAGAVATKNILPFTLNGGIPAKIIGIRPSPLTYEFDGSSCHFF